MLLTGKDQSFLLLYFLHYIDSINEQIKCKYLCFYNRALCKGTVPIPGVRTLKQAEENISAAQFRLSPGMVDELDRVALDLSKPMIQNIFQTE